MGNMFWWENHKKDSPVRAPMSNNRLSGTKRKGRLKRHDNDAETVFIACLQTNNCSVYAPESNLAE